jgi:hypothetical protein
MIPPMSRIFESFEFLDKGWDIRALENQSVRSVFLWLLPLLFVLGADTVPRGLRGLPSTPR